MKLNLSFHASNIKTLFSAIDKKQEGSFDYAGLCAIMLEQEH